MACATWLHAGAATQSTRRYGWASMLNAQNAVNNTRLRVGITVMPDAGENVQQKLGRTEADYHAGGEAGKRRALGGYRG